MRPYFDPVVAVRRGVQLRNADGFFGKSDPFAKVLGVVGASANWGETKTIRDNLNPVWEEEFQLPILSKMPLGGKLIPLTIEVRIQYFIHCSPP